MPFRACPQIGPDPAGRRTSFFQAGEPSSIRAGFNDSSFPEFRHAKTRWTHSAFDRYAREPGTPHGGSTCRDGPRFRFVASRHAQPVPQELFVPGPLRARDPRSLRPVQFAIIPSSCETYGHCIAEPFIRGVFHFDHLGVAKDLIRHGEKRLSFRHRTTVASAAAEGHSRS